MIPADVVYIPENMSFVLLTRRTQRPILQHYGDVIMGAIASQITSLTIVYSTVYSGADQRKHQSSASLAFVRGIHRGPVNSPHKWPVTREMFPFDDVIMSMYCPSRDHGPLASRTLCCVSMQNYSCPYYPYDWWLLHRPRGNSMMIAQGLMLLKLRSVISPLWKFKILQMKLSWTIRVNKTCETRTTAK